jgi:hypothetical protein
LAAGLVRPKSLKSCLNSGSWRARCPLPLRTSRSPTKPREADGASKTELLEELAPFSAQLGNRPCNANDDAETFYSCGGHNYIEMGTMPLS